MMKRKAIALFMTAVMTASVMIPVYAEEETLTQPVKTLMSLGIIEDSLEFDYEKAVTRIEFIEMVMNIADSNTYSTEIEFSDVTEDLPGYDAVMSAASMGLIIGTGNGLFEPDKQITFAQAIRTLVSLAGYTSQAEYLGGFPSGYMSVGRTLDLYKSADPDAGLTNKDCVSLLLNVIDAPYMKLSGINNNHAEFNADDKWTVLREYRNIIKSKGIISANSQTSLYSSTAGTAAGQVKIDETLYDVNDTQADLLLGYKVDFYYKDEDENSDSGKTLICVDTANYNTVTEIGTVGTDYSDGVLTYEDGTRNKSVKIPVTASVIYNGVAAGTFITQDNFVPEHGKIVLIDNGSGKGVSVVRIYSYRTMVVLAVNENKSLISGKYEEILDLSSLQQGTEYRIRDDYGNEIPVEMLREWDVLSILEAPDGSFIDIEVSDRKISSTVTSVTEEYIVMDDTEYRLCPELIKSGTSIKAGRSGTFYLDVLGYIAGVSLEEIENQIAYLTRAFMDDYGENAMIQLLLPEGDGVLQTFQCTSSVNINGKRYKGEEIINRLRDVDSIEYQSDGADILRQVVMYDTDEDGYIKKLVLPENESSDNLYCSYRNPGRTIKSKSYGYERSIADRQIVLSKDVIIFIVPQDPNMADKDKIYSVKTVDYMLSRTSTEDIVEAYHTSDKNLGADVVVFYVGSVSGGDIQNDSPISVVDRWETGLNEDDEIVQKLYLFGNEGEKVLDVSPDFNLEQIEVTTDNETSYRALGTGDIIRYSQNSTGEVTFIQICYSHEDNTTYNYGEFSSTYKYVYRTDKESGLVMTAGLVNGNIPFEGVDFDSFELSRFKVYVYDGSVKKNHITAGTVQDIMPYNSYMNDCSRIVINRQSDDPRSIVIYNN